MRELRSKKKWVDDYNTSVSLVSDLEVLYDYYKEGEASEEDVMQQFSKATTLIEGLEFRNMLSDEGDNMSAVLQITAGAGGTESCDWRSEERRVGKEWRTRSERVKC